ncbi:MAG: P-loop NTPase fold protein, partial [Nitrospirota bacterium]|nr:P-loop NTPase fold protein [Nitrospirota bacterium]
MNDSRVTSKDLALAILFSASNISLKAVKETAFIPAMETFLDGVDSGALEALLKTYNVRTSGEVYYVPQGATVPEIELNQPFVSLTAQEQSLPLDGDAEIVLVAATQLAIARTGSEAAVVATEDILKSFLLAAKQKIPLPGLGLFSELNPEFHTVVDPMLEKLKPKPELVRTNYAADIGHVGEDGVDTLDVNPYTQAFARLILDKAVAPPLSIGLFGDWGSGKSYFMSLMDCEIVSLAKQASIQPQFGGVYYSHPMVVHFNAWHYVETNLWASLVNVIFTALETELSDAKDKAPDAKDKAHADFIFGKMQSIREAERELEKRKKELDNARLVLAEVSRNQEQKRGELSGLLKFGGWAKLVIDQLPKDAKEKLNKFSSERGFRDPHEVVRQLAEATGQRGGIRRVLQLLLAIFRQHPKS